MEYFMKTLHIAMLITALTLNLSTYTVGCLDSTPSWRQQSSTSTYSYTNPLSEEEKAAQKAEQARLQKEQERMAALVKAQQQAEQARLEREKKEAAQLAANIKAVQEQLKNEQKDHEKKIKELNGQLAVLKRNAGQNNLFSCCTIS